MPQFARRRILSSNDQGFTLVELLVAVVILMVGLLGLLQGVNVAIMENLKNELRNKALSIAEAELAIIKNRSFDSISTNTKSSVTTAQIRSVSKQFNVVDQVTATGTNTKNIQVGVSWTHKGVTFEQTISTLLSNPNAN